MLEIGPEITGANKKLAIFSGTTQIQIIDGDAVVLRDIANPNIDWAASGYPTHGVVYQGRFIVYGSINSPHRIYGSDFGDFEDFTGAETIEFGIFQGEADRIISSIVFRGVMVLFKEPFGIYFVDGTQSIVNPVIQKYSDAFGLASPHAIAQGLQDVLAFNTFGSLTSLKTTDQFGDLESGDVFSNAKVENEFRDLLDNDGFSISQAIYYPEKKAFYFTARASQTNQQNRIIILDVNGDNLRIHVETKSQANVLALRRDDNNIQRPIYGTDTGDVFEMDGSTFNVDGQSYEGSFKLTNTDLSFADPGLADKNKIFDFVTVYYRSRGNFPFQIEASTDLEIRDVVTVPGVAQGTLDAFVLGSSRLSDRSIRTARVPLRSCYGRRISLRFYNTGLDETFQIEQITLSFRPANEGVTP